MTVGLFTQKERTNMQSNDAIYALAGQYIGQTEAVTALQALVNQLSAQLDAATVMQLDAAVGHALATTERRAFDVGLYLGRNPDGLLFKLG